MARPRNEHPTPAELEVLKILWSRGPATVREVRETLKGQRRRRAYTSVMSLLGVMTDKGLVKRKQHGRAFLYTARTPRDGGRVPVAFAELHGSAPPKVSHNRALRQVATRPEA